MKEFAKVCTYKKYIEDLSGGINPNSTAKTASHIANIMAAAMQAQTANKGFDAPANLEAVWKLSEAIQASPVLQELTKNPDAVKLAQEGKADELIVKFAETSEKLAQAAKNPQPQVQENQADLSGPKVSQPAPRLAPEPDL